MCKWIWLRMVIGMMWWELSIDCSWSLKCYYNYYYFQCKWHCVWVDDRLMWSMIYLLIRNPINVECLLHSHFSPDESNGKEEDLGHGQYKHAEVREYRVHAAILYVGVKARVQEDHIRRNGAHVELRVPAGGKGHVSRLLKQRSLGWVIEIKSIMLLFNFNVQMQWRGHAEHNFDDIG